MPKKAANTKGNQTIHRENLLKNFKCKCSKAYASYAAVYTHIKNKHPDEV